MSASAPNQERFVVKTVRISVIGEQGCGKSTFVEQFITGRGKLSKSAISFETERTMTSRILKRETASMHGVVAAPQHRQDIVTRYDVHVHDSCASPVTSFVGLEHASIADVVMICFNMYGSNISVLFQVFLDLFKVCHAASRHRPLCMLVGLNKKWDKVQMTKVEATETDSKSAHTKPSENLCTIVSRIQELFQCKLNFVTLCQESENENSAKAMMTNQSSGHLPANFLPYSCITAVEAFARAVDEFEMSRERFLPRGSVCDSSLYRLYFSAQRDRLACTLKNGWAKDTHVEAYIFPDFVGISLVSCNLPDAPQRMFDVVDVQYLDLSDNPLTKLNDGFSRLQILSVLNASNTKLSMEPYILLACTALTELNISRNMLPNASCLLKCGSLKNLDLSENMCPVTLDSTVADFKLTSLACLNLSKTMCTSFDFVQLLVSLVDLNLRETGVRDGSLVSLSQLRRLRHIDLSHNKLTELSIPVHIETVLVENNHLKSFHICCFNSSQHKLTKLNLKNNQLAELPKQLWHVLSLRDLSFAGNNVTMLDFSFAFCSSRIVKCDSEGNPFNLMPPAVADLLGNNRFFEACDMSIKPLPAIKISVLSKPKCPNFEAVTRKLSQVKMIVNIQEKGLNSSKVQWTKTLILATFNPPRLYFLSPENDVDANSLDAVIKDKPYWDIRIPAFKFNLESGGPRQFLGKISMLVKSAPGSTSGKIDSFPPSKVIDFFSESNRQQLDQYFKSIARFRSNDRENIFFKSMPGFLSDSFSRSVNFKSVAGNDPSLLALTSPSASTTYSVGDSAHSAKDSDASKSMLPVQDSVLNFPTSSTVALSASTSFFSAALPATSETIGYGVSSSEQQISCKFNTVYLSAPIFDMNFFLPFFVNSDLVVVNLAENAITCSELSRILSGIRLVSNRCPKYVFVVVNQEEIASINDSIGKSYDASVKIVYVHQYDIFIDEVREALKLLSTQNVMEPFSEYFQSFISGVVKSRPPWTESESMMISFSELLNCIYDRRNSFDALGKCCLSFLEDMSYDIHQYLLQTCEIFDRCGILLSWNAHTSDPVIILNLDMFGQDIMIPLLHTARHRKEVLAEGRQQAPNFSSNRVLFTPQERVLIWSNIPAMTSKLMSDLDWALVALHIAAVTSDLPILSVSDGLPSASQPPRDSLSDCSSSSIAVHKKEGWIYLEDATSRNVKKKWFVCSCGADGIYSLTWRNSENASATSSSQSVSFAKSTKTTVSQTKKNRAGWSHCCRIDHEQPLASAKKILMTKIVMCFNNEREMREWWSLIEMVTQRDAPVAHFVSDLDSTATKTDVIDPQSPNLMVFYEDEVIPSESSSLSLIFEGIGVYELGDRQGDDVLTVTHERIAPPHQNMSSRWMGFRACIKEASEFVLRSVMCSLSLYLEDSMADPRDGTIRAIFKRRSTVRSSDRSSGSRSRSTSVLVFKSSSLRTDISVISAGHECHVMADILLEAIVRSTRTGAVQCTVSAMDDITSIAETYGLSSLIYEQYIPSISSSYSFTSLIPQPKLPNIRRIVHIHNVVLNENNDDSRRIRDWADRNHWQYSQFSCIKSESIQATRMAAASPKLVLILEASFTVFRGRSVHVVMIFSSLRMYDLMLSLNRSRVRWDFSDSSDQVSKSILSLTEVGCSVASDFCIFIYFRGPCCQTFLRVPSEPRNTCGFDLNCTIAILLNLLQMRCPMATTG